MIDFYFVVTLVAGFVSGFLFGMWKEKLSHLKWLRQQIRKGV